MILYCIYFSDLTDTSLSMIMFMSIHVSANGIISSFLKWLSSIPFYILIGCCCLVAKSCLTLLQPMDCSTPGSSVHRIPQSRILEWFAISFSRGSTQSLLWGSLIVSSSHYIIFQNPFQVLPSPGSLSEPHKWLKDICPPLIPEEIVMTTCLGEKMPGTPLSPNLKKL